MGWLTGWAHRKKLTIGGSVGGAQTDYLRGIRAYYGSGADGTEVMGGVTYGKVYCENLCKTDFGDIRFTSSDGTSLLDYWMLDKTDSTDVLFWVETDTPASPSTVDIYVYLGNAGATSISDSTLNPVSNPDFEIDYAGWTLNLDDGSCYGEGGQTWWSETGLASMRLRTHNSGAMGNGADITQTVVIPATGYNLWYSAYCGYTGGGLDNNDICKATCDVGGVNFWSQNFARTTGTGEYNNQEDISAQSGSKIVKFRNERVAAGGGWYDSRFLWIDYVLIRKYVNPEPSFDSWSSMEDPQLDLYGKFEVGQGSVDLDGEFVVSQWAEDLHGEFVVGQWAEDLLGEFVVRPESSVDLKAQVNIVHSISLPASFHVGQDSEALKGEFAVRQSQYGQLPATFEVDHITDLPARFIVRHTVPDPIKFEVFGPYLARNTVTQDDGIIYPFQRKVWHAAGRRWIFFVWSFNFRHTSSLDGISWNTPTIIRGVTYNEAGHLISTWVDNEGYLHYVYGPRVSGGDLKYRKGLLEAGGTITWSAAEQTIAVPGGWLANYPSICVDAAGYPWIGLNYESATLNYARILKSDTKDGTWTTNPNYPANFTPGVWNNAVVCPLTNGQVFLYWGGEDVSGGITHFIGALCDGDGPGTPVTRDLSASDQAEWYTCSAIPVGNSVVAGMVCTDLTLHVCKWRGGGWGSDTIIQTGMETNTAPAFFKIGNVPYVSWVNLAEDEIRYKFSLDEGVTWEPSGDTSYRVLITDPSGIEARIRMSMEYEARSLVGFSWVRASNRIMYGWLEPESAPELKAVFDVGQDSVDFLARFDVGQGSADLFGEFEAQATTELLGKFVAQATAELLNRFEVGQGSAELLARFLIPRAYDFSSGMGISFDWWGSGGVDQQIDFEMWSLTGGWVGRFPDGPAEWRQVQLSWDDLTPVDLDGTRPDSSQIIGIYWTYHTPGIRRIDGIRAWMRQNLLCKVVIRHAGTSDLLSKFEAQVTAELLGKAVVRNISSAELPGNSVIRHSDTAELLCKFEAQATADLLGRFEAQTSLNLLADLIVRHQSTAEIFGKFELS